MVPALSGLCVFLCGCHSTTRHMETSKKNMAVKKIFPLYNIASRVSFSLWFGDVLTPLYETTSM